MLDSRTDSQPQSNTGNEYADQSTGNKSYQGGGDDLSDDIPFLCEWRA
jgi:hypothetical protein